MTEQTTDYDSPWKEVIEAYFPRFLEFFFPQVYAEIEWNRPYEFLDTELQQLEPDAEIGKRLVDKVAKVWLVDGELAWVLVHVEVQGQYDSTLTERMYVYNYRLFDRHRKRVISLAVLADEQPNWRPSSYSYQLGGCRISLEFPVVKLLDYEEQWQRIQESTNPFAVVVMAHLKTKVTHQNPENRLHWKLSLVKVLYERGYNREDIQQLFRFIDWLMVLPDNLARSFKQQVKNYEEAQKMKYVTSIEQLAKQEGLEQGLEQGTLQTNRENIIEILQMRFGAVPKPIVDAVNTINNVSVLKTLLRRAIAIGSVVEFQQTLNDTTS